MGSQHSKNSFYGFPSYDTDRISKIKSQSISGMKQDLLSNELLLYLQENVFAFPNPNDLLQDNAFVYCVDYPDLQHESFPSSHNYFEGCFHSFETSNHVQSIHPRTGVSSILPAAPIQLRAFLSLFRQFNSNSILSTLDFFSSKFSLQDNIYIQLLVLLLKQDKLFASVAVQFHWGVEVVGEDLGWHRDGLNSLLHLGLTLRGKRALHSIRKPITLGPTTPFSSFPSLVISTASPNLPFTSPPSPLDLFNSLVSLGPLQEIVEEQFPGSLYLSSPSAYLHAPSYPSTSRALFQKKKKTNYSFSDQFTSLFTSSTHHHHQQQQSSTCESFSFSSFPSHSLSIMSRLFISEEDYIQLNIQKQEKEKEREKVKEEKGKEEKGNSTQWKDKERKETERKREIVEEDDGKEERERNHPLDLALDLDSALLVLSLSIEYQLNIREGNEEDQVKGKQEIKDEGEEKKEELEIRPHHLSPRRLRFPTLDQLTREVQRLTEISINERENQKEKE